MESPWTLMKGVLPKPRLGTPESLDTWVLTVAFSKGLVPLLKLKQGPHLFLYGPTSFLEPNYFVFFLEWFSITSMVVYGSGIDIWHNHDCFEQEPEVNQVQINSDKVTTIYMYHWLLIWFLSRIQELWPRASLFSFLHIDADFQWDNFKL